MINNINYQRIFEDLNGNAREGAGFTERFYELPQEQRQLVEDIIDATYQQAVEDMLDPEVITDTMVLAGEMGTQLYNFANMLKNYVSDADHAGDTTP